MAGLRHGSGMGLYDRDYMRDRDAGSGNSGRSGARLTSRQRSALWIGLAILLGLALLMAVLQ